MQKLQTLLRTAVRHRTTLFARGLRLQSSQHGPHKEYFQDPAHFPTAAEVARTPIRQDAPDLSNALAFQQPVQPKTGPSRLVRAVRGTALATLCLAFGIVMGTAVVTWDYIQPPFEQGSEEEQELMDGINDVISSHPLIHDMSEKGWRQDVVHVPRAEGEEGRIRGDQHFLYETLGPTHGIVSAIFRHPTEHCTLVAFFPCFGVEGWPDVVHGGMLSTMLIEALQQHCVVYAEEGIGFTCEAFPFNFNFSKPVRPGELYAVVMAPPAYSIIHATGDDDAQSLPVIQANVTGILMRVEGAPQLLSEEEVKQRGLAMPSPGNGEVSTHMLFDGKAGELCSTMSANVVLIPKVPNAGGSLADKTDLEVHLQKVLEMLKQKRGQISIAPHPGMNSPGPKSG